MHTCTYRNLCNKLKNLLDKLSIAGVRTCPKDETECLNILYYLQYIDSITTPVTADIIWDYLKDNLPDVANIKDLENVTPFKCPELDIDIFVPCQLESCAFFTANRWTDNCIIKYINTQNASSIKSNEIRFLLGLTQAQLRRITNSAMSKLQQQALRVKVQDLALKTATPIPAEGCSVCGSKKNIYKLTGGFVFCSSACYKKKSVLELKLESDFNIPIKNLVELSISNFSGVKRASNALGIKISEMRRLLAKYHIPVPE